MLTNAELFQRSGDNTRARVREPRTMYVIKLTSSNAYVRARSYTNDVRHASHFELMTTALIYAFIVLELAPEDFDVKGVAVSA